MIYCWVNRSELKGSLNVFYRSIGISKQGFAQLMQRQNQWDEERYLLIELIRGLREDHPRMNCKDLYYKIKPELMGRDRFERFCKQEGLLVGTPKNFRRTTDSQGVIRFANLLRNQVIDGINQAWSSDITYYELNGTFYYLTFIIDNYSRRIMGYSLSNRLYTEATSLPALKMAIKNRGKTLPKGIIFHSDGGGQYYDKEFLKLTGKYQFRNSMCEYAWENGQAERINGIIKNNYLIPWKSKTLGQLEKNLDRAVLLYNQEKPHCKLNKMSPIEFEKKIVNIVKPTFSLPLIKGKEKSIKC